MVSIPSTISRTTINMAKGSAMTSSHSIGVARKPSPFSENIFANSTKYSSNLYEKPNPGKNLNLSIDLNIQSYALTRLQNLNQKKSKFNEPATGSVVVMNVNTGELVCCVSSPNFNPNIFTRGIKSKEWKSLINNKKAPS